MKHTHRVKSTVEQGWNICVTPHECAAHPDRQAAHGCIVRADTCKCGAVRLTEVNGVSRNRGEWEQSK